jgi:hypothetical protein
MTQNRPARRSPTATTEQAAATLKQVNRYAHLIHLNSPATPSASRTPRC